MIAKREYDQYFGRSRKQTEEMPVRQLPVIAEKKFSAINFRIIQTSSGNICQMLFGVEWQELLIEEVLFFYADRCGEPFLDWLRKHTDVLEKPVPLTYEKYLSKIKNYD